MAKTALPLSSYNLDATMSLIVGHTFTSAGSVDLNCELGLNPTITREEVNVSNSLPVIPLAFVMIAGPQIISAFFLATTVDARRTSLAYVGGVAVATVLETSVLFIIASVLDLSAKSSGHSKSWVTYLLAGILIVVAAIVFLRRANSRPPKWMGTLTNATPRFSFRLGLLLFLVMPTDVLTMVAVATALARDNQSLVAAIPSSLSRFCSSPSRY